MGLTLSLLRFQRDSIQVADTALNFANLGAVNMKRLGDVPYYSFKHNGRYLLRDDATYCGGACYDFLSKYILFGWENYSSKTINDQTNSGFFDGRICDANDVGKEQYDQGILYICPPYEGLEMENRAFSYPNKHFSFGIT